MKIPQENRYNLLVVGPLASKPAYSKMTKLGENPRPRVIFIPLSWGYVHEKCKAGCKSHAPKLKTQPGNLSH